MKTFKDITQDKHLLESDYKVIKEEVDLDELSMLTKMKARLARGVRGPSKKATPTWARETGRAAAKIKSRAQSSKVYHQGRKRRNESMNTFKTFCLNEESRVDTALKTKAEKSGMPLSVLRTVYNRGVAAWRTGHRPGTTPSQWGLARVNSFATKSKGTWGKADKDLADKVRGKK